MLSTRMLKEEVDAILDLIAQSKTEEAKQRIQLLAPQVSSDTGRGTVLALNGILTSITKRKGNDQAPNPEKLRIIAERVGKTQITDDLDRAYLQTLVKWAKKTTGTKAESQAPENAPQA